jgi:hypothetical protein
VLDHTSQRVPVRRNQDPLPGPGQQTRSEIERKKQQVFFTKESLWSYLLDLGNDDVVPVGKGALNGQLEGLVHGELLLARLVLVALILETKYTLSTSLPTSVIFAF